MLVSRKEKYDSRKWEMEYKVANSCSYYPCILQPYDEHFLKKFYCFYIYSCIHYLVQLLPLFSYNHFSQFFVVVFLLFIFKFMGLAF
jgi:hypothetical protein